MNNIKSDHLSVYSYFTNKNKEIESTDETQVDENLLNNDNEENNLIDEENNLNEDNDYENNDYENNDSFIGKLSWSERLIGYFICYFLGLVLTIGSYARLDDALHGNPTEFAIFLSLGSIISIMSSLFLSGPSSQCKSMFEEKRYIASITYISSIIAVFIIIFLPEFTLKLLLLIIIIIIQYLSWFWYTITYIPFVREFIKKCLCFY